MLTIKCLKWFLFFALIKWFLKIGGYAVFFSFFLVSFIFFIYIYIIFFFIFLIFIGVRVVLKDLQ